MKLQKNGAWQHCGQPGARREQLYENLYDQIHEQINKLSLQSQLRGLILFPLSDQLCWQLYEHLRGSQ